MKKASVGVILLMFLVFAVWRWHIAYSLHKPVNLQDVSRIEVWGVHTNTRSVTNAESEKIVSWFNSATNIRENKEFAGTTPDSGIRIEIKSKETIGIINSGKDFEVQREINGRNVSYWAEQRDIDNLLDQLEKQSTETRNKIANDIFYSKAVVSDLRNGLNPNNPHDAKVLEQISKKLQIINEIETAFKENKKPLEDIRKELNAAQKIKIDR